MIGLLRAQFRLAIHAGEIRVRIDFNRRFVRHAALETHGAKGNDANADADHDDGDDVAHQSTSSTMSIRVPPTASSIFLVSVTLNLGSVAPITRKNLSREASSKRFLSNNG